MMKFLKTKVATSKRVRASAAPSAAAVAAVPSASAPVSENSRASVAAVAELIESLDFIFEQLDSESEPGDLLRLHLQRLASEAGKYENARIGDDAGTAWSSTPPDTARLLYAACQCSSYIYKPEPSDDFNLIPVITRTPSVSGTEKAASIFKLEATNTLIFTVRGTASVVDHMVNLNSTPKDARKLFDLGLDWAYLNAHAGFLSCATTLRPIMFEDLARAVKADSSISRIVFTGHSAGGAVSSLLFLHMISTTPPELRDITFGLATFGSPPVLSLNVTDTACQFPNADFAYAFVNEYDLVARADPSYLKSVIDLYKLRYGLPSAVDDCPDSDTPEKGSWRLPPSTFHPVGDVVILKSRVCVSPSIEESEPSPKISTKIEALQISPTVFSQALFCEVGVHKRRVYLDRMKCLFGPKSGEDKEKSALANKTTSLWSESSTLQGTESDWPLQAWNYNGEDDNK